MTSKYEINPMGKLGAMVSGLGQNEKVIEHLLDHTKYPYFSETGKPFVDWLKQYYDVIRSRITAVRTDRSKMLGLVDEPIATIQRDSGKDFFKSDCLRRKNAVNHKPNKVFYYSVYVAEFCKTFNKTLEANCFVSLRECEEQNSGGNFFVRRENFSECDSKAHCLNGLYKHRWNISKLTRSELVKLWQIENVLRACFIVIPRNKPQKELFLSVSSILATGAPVAGGGKSSVVGAALSQLLFPRILTETSPNNWSKFERLPSLSIQSPASVRHSVLESEFSAEGDLEMENEIEADMRPRVSGSSSGSKGSLEEVNECWRDGCVDLGEHLGELGPDFLSLYQDESFECDQHSESDSLEGRDWKKPRVREDCVNTLFDLGGECSGLPTSLDEYDCDG